MIQKKSVILVEDDPDDREIFTLFFAKRDDVHLLPCLEDGVELMKFLDRTESDHSLPDLIILDQNMPKMNGKQTLQFLKSHPRYSHIATMIYSTYADTTLIHECKKLGANMVAIKPIDDQGYQKMMDDFLGYVNQLPERRVNV